MGNNQDDRCHKLYMLCKQIAEHPLHDVEQSLILHQNREDFRKDIDFKISNKLNHYGNDLKLYDKQDGHKLENGYRLLYKKQEYVVTSSEMNVPRDNYDLVVETVEKKRQAFDRMFALLDQRARNESETDIGLQQVIDEYCDSWLFYKDNKFSLKMKGNRVELCANLLDNYLGIDENKDFEKWEEVDISTLILIILDALPAYGRPPKSYQIEDAFSKMLDFIQSYYHKRSHLNCSAQIISIKEKRNDHQLPMNRYTLITSLKKIIEGLWSEVSPGALTDQNDYLLFAHRQFCDSYNIQGVWLDDRGRYWSIRETGDYCLLYLYNFDSKRIYYTKYTLITSIIKDHIGSFNIREASNVMELFKGGKIDINRIDDLEVTLDIPRNQKSVKKKIRAIKLESTKFQHHIFGFKKLIRANDYEHSYLVNKWNTLERVAYADYTFFRSMVAITPEHIYIGSFKRDDEGRHAFFYQISKDRVDGVMGDHGYYIDFNQSVGIYEAKWLKQGEIIIKHYLAVDSQSIFIDTDDILANKISGISVIDTPQQVRIIQDFVETDQKGENRLTKDKLELYADPFYFLTEDS